VRRRLDDEWSAVIGVLIYGTLEVVPAGSGRKDNGDHA
jgi:hypothetical protein